MQARAARQHVLAQQDEHVRPPEQLQGLRPRQSGSSNHAARFPRPTTPPRNVEYVVRYPDGTFSEPGTLPEIQTLAEATGGNVRARVKRDPGV